MTLKDMKPARVCGSRQNCYVCDTASPTFDSRHIKPETKFPSLDRKHLPNGFTEEVVEKDYPINSDSVTSYADGADYRNDPLQAIVNAPKRVNLGDVTEVQRFIQEDPQNSARVFRDVVAKLREYEAKTKAGQTAQPTQEPAKGGE